MVTKLAKLVDSEEFNKLNPANQSELLFQKSHMLNVLIGLNRRIEKAQKAKPPGPE